MSAEKEHRIIPAEGHKSLHSYLDAVFKDTPDPSEEEIIVAKKVWRRHYLSSYHKEYGMRLVQVSFRISRKQYNVYAALAKSEVVSVNRYIKNLVVRKSFHRPSGIPAELPVLLLEAIDLVEESEEEKEPVDTHRLISILKQCQTLIDDCQGTFT